MSRRPRILITAFEPFGGRDLNPSQELLEALPEQGGIDRLLLPVSIAGTWPMLAARVAESDPDIVLAMGEASGRREISLEARAFNEIDLRIPDNDGMQPRGEVILASGPPVLESDLPLRELAGTLRDLGHPLRVSLDAGRHLCNLVLYRLLEQGRKAGRPQASFLHLPLLPEQRGSAEAVPCLPLATQLAALESLLGCLQCEEP